jgi:phenylalanyl-tRNA synthetase beta chain
VFGEGRGLIHLANPLSSDMNVLRPSLVPGLLDVLKHNINHKNNDLALFEMGRVFNNRPATSEQKSSKPGEIPLCERGSLAIALTGRRSPPFWSGADRDAKCDISDLKGLLEDFFDAIGLRGVAFARRSEACNLYAESASVQLGKYQVGRFGQIQPVLAKQYDLRDAVLLGELDLDLILDLRHTGKSFKPLPAFPAIRRDVAMLVPEVTTHESVLQTVKQARPANLESVELFDVFRGQHVAAGQRSMAYAFIYRSPERTLTDAEVNAEHEKLVNLFKQRLQAVVRE